MATIKGIYKHYEGLDSQCSGIQLERELTWATNVGPTGCLRYLDCSGNHHYIYPDGQYFYPTTDYYRGNGVYYSGPSGVNDFIKFGPYGFIRYNGGTGQFEITADSGNPLLIKHDSNAVIISGSNSVTLTAYGGVGGRVIVNDNAQILCDCGTINMTNTAGSVNISGFGGIYLHGLPYVDPGISGILWASGGIVAVSQG